MRLIMPSDDGCLASFELRQDDIYAINQDRLVRLQNPRFELLFDSGVIAYLIGFEREAILDFAAALEEFYLFYVRLIAYTKACEGLEIDKLVKKCDRSERRLGAFVATYLTTNGVAPQVLSNSNVTLRNNVVHKGHIPSRAETYKFGENTFKLIAPEVNRLKDSYSEELIVQNIERMQEITTERTAERIDSLVIPCIVSTVRGDPISSFADGLEEMKGLIGRAYEIRG